MQKKICKGKKKPISLSFAHNFERSNVSVRKKIDDLKL